MAVQHLGALRPHALGELLLPSLDGQAPVRKVSLHALLFLAAWLLSPTTQAELYL